MPDPKRYLNDDVTYIKAHVRRRKIPNKKNTPWIPIILFGSYLFIGSLFSWTLAIILSIVGILIYMGLLWLRWRVMRIKSDGVDNYWIYLIKGGK